MTIEEHQKIIGAKGYVWWGWWNKQGETVPEAAFRAVGEEIKKSGPLEVHLFDSGQNQLRRACIDQIEWDKGLQLIPTPERGATPNYYRDSRYLAWFRLGQIETATLPESDLKKWSYVQIDEFFENKKSIFEAFYNKQVSSFAELRSQDRTIWFVRAFQLADAVHEIRVYDQSKAAPRNYPQEVVQAHSNNLLWVSDTHFRRTTMIFRVTAVSPR